MITCGANRLETQAAQPTRRGLVFASMYGRCNRSREGGIKRPCAGATPVYLGALAGGIWLRAHATGTMATAQVAIAPCGSPPCSAHRREQPRDEAGKETGTEALARRIRPGVDDAGTGSVLAYSSNMLSCADGFCFGLRSAGVFACTTVAPFACPSVAALA